MLHCFCFPAYCVENIDETKDYKNQKKDISSKVMGTIYNVFSKECKNVINQEIISALKHIIEVKGFELEHFKHKSGHSAYKITKDKEKIIFALVKEGQKNITYSKKHIDEWRDSFTKLGFGKECLKAQVYEI